MKKIVLFISILLLACSKDELIPIINSELKIDGILFTPTVVNTFYNSKENQNYQSRTFEMTKIINGKEQTLSFKVKYPIGKNTINGKYSFGPIEIGELGVDGRYQDENGFYYLSGFYLTVEETSQNKFLLILENVEAIDYLNGISKPITGKIEATFNQI